MSLPGFIAPRRGTQRAYSANSRPRRIHQPGFGEGAAVEFSDGTAVGECLCCPDRPCIQYSDEETTASVILEITRDPNRDVCPFDAVTVDTSGAPVISEAACSGCGLCVTRCPVGAIAWSDTGTAVVQAATGIITEPTEDLASHLLARDRGFAAKELYVPEGHEWHVLRKRFDDESQGLRPTFLRILVRNLLRGLGVAAHAGVRGDTSDRTEITFSDGEVVGVVEIEARGDLLEGVRRVMTTVAVAHSRRGVSRANLSPAVFVLQMPNQRTDGYELVRDLSEVLDLEVAILPIAALHLAMFATGQDVLGHLIDAGRRVDRRAEALDVGPYVTAALELPPDATAGSTAFRPPK